MRGMFFIACRLVFGAVFVYAGAEKMMDPQTFASVIFNYQVLPAKLVYGAALLLPPLEVVCGLALCAGSLARGAAVVLNALMAVFIALMGLALARGLDVTCGCFGGAGQAVGKETLLRDGAFLLLGLAALVGTFLEARDS